MIAVTDTQCPACKSTDLQDEEVTDWIVTGEDEATPVVTPMIFCLCCGNEWEADDNA